MKMRISNLLNKLFVRKSITVLICSLLTAVCMIYVFIYQHHREPFAYAAYLFSAYSLTILLVRLYRSAKPKVIKLLQKNKWVNRYFTDIKFKTVVSLHISLAINAFYTLMELCMGMYYHSAWFVTMSVYYLFLTAMRYSLIKYISFDNIGRDILKEYKKYRFCAVMLLLMNFTLSGIVVLMLAQEQQINYAGTLIYLMAAYTFYFLITAIRDLIVFRRYGSPVISAAKAVSFAAVLVSMLSLEAAMISRFDTGNIYRFRNTMVTVSGGFICLTYIAVSLYMIRKSGRKIKSLSNENHK